MEEPIVDQTSVEPVTPIVEESTIEPIVEEPVVEDIPVEPVTEETPIEPALGNENKTGETKQTTVIPNSFQVNIPKSIISNINTSLFSDDISNDNNEYKKM